MTKSTGMTQNDAGAAPSGAAPRLCSKCGINPRSKRGSWCTECRRSYQRDYNRRTRPAVRLEEDVPCAAPDCDATFTWRSTHPGQKYCTRACYLRVFRRSQPPRVYDPVRKRRETFKRRGYGITPEAFDTLVRQQEGRCAICTLERTLVPDHCHERRLFRGAICEACNHGLGKFYDNPAALRAAAAYLERSGPK